MGLTGLNSSKAVRMIREGYWGEKMMLKPASVHHPLQVRTHSSEGTGPLWPPLPGKAIKLFFSTSPKTLSLTFDSALMHGDGVSHATTQHKGE